MSENMKIYLNETDDDISISEMPEPKVEVRVSGENWITPTTLKEHLEDGTVRISYPDGSVSYE